MKSSGYDLASEAMQLTMSLPSVSVAASHSLTLSHFITDAVSIKLQRIAQFYSHQGSDCQHQKTICHSSSKMNNELLKSQLSALK